MVARPSQLYIDQDMVEAEPLELGLGSVAVYSARAPEKQSPNEDAAAVIPSEADSGLLAVADGLGGAASGEHAASLALETLRAAVEAQVREPGLLRTAILDGIEAANQAVLGLGVGAATTLAVLEIQAATVRPYHVGDSMILAVGQRGKIKLQSRSRECRGQRSMSGGSGFSEEDSEPGARGPGGRRIASIIRRIWSIISCACSSPGDCGGGKSDRGGGRASFDFSRMSSRIRAEKALPSGLPDCGIERGYDNARRHSNSALP